MQIIADLQLHSKYSRAVSEKMVLSHIREWAKRKGIGLIATGDWNHPLWMREIKANLEEIGNGLLRIRNQESGIKNDEREPLFLLATEVSCIYSQGGKGRRVHTLIWAPSISVAEKINQELVKRGANLLSDGRPIVGLTSMQIAEVVFSVDPTCLIIPAHAWTPWFSLYGSESGFDSIEECFGGYAKNIYAIETGLSSDPAMNWRIKELDNRSILSFSDAHSGPKLGREATVFELPEVSYTAIRQAIMNTGAAHVAYTVEFYPEEGKYHYTGHRNCDIKQTPEESKKKGMICPVCGRKLTVGVMHRVEDLAGRTEAELRIVKRALEDTKMEAVYSDAFPKRAPYVMMVPLQEIISEAIGGAVTTRKVQTEYIKLTDRFDNEFEVLLRTPVEDVVKLSGPRVAEAIDKVRNGDIFIDPGYDGVFGKVEIWGEQKEEENKKDQLSLF